MKAKILKQVNKYFVKNELTIKDFNHPSDTYDSIE